jgi:hypothetical protein
MGLGLVHIHQVLVAERPIRQGLLRECAAHPGDADVGLLAHCITPAEVGIAAILADPLRLNDPHPPAATSEPGNLHPRLVQAWVTDGSWLI